MQKFRLILLGFFLGVGVTLLVLPELSFEQRTIDADLPNRERSKAEESIPQTASYTVTHVVDGDTIDVVSADGESMRIRLIGIDTPETVDPDRPIGCFGEQASKRMKELLRGEMVTLFSKPDEDMDQHGRFLRYVHADGVDVSRVMLREGYARSLCKKYPHPRCKEYEQEEQNAASSRIGLHGACAK